MKILKFFIFTAILSLLFADNLYAQDMTTFNQDDALSSGDRQINRQDRKAGSRDTTKEIPRGLFTWTLDPIGGDRTFVEPDTTWYMRMNHVFAEGVYGEYNTTGNNGSPRESRIFMNRKTYGNFIFTNPYSQFIVQPEDFHFTNTYSPITNITYHSCGDKTDGEDLLKALFSVNVNKQVGFGFKFDYLYARGYYQNQSTSHFNYSMWGSYIGDRYNAHLLISLNHEKVKENGGITDEEYILHPQSFSDSYATNEIPTQLTLSYNKNNNQHIFFNHRYNIGFSRKVPMTEQEIEAKKFAMKSEQDRMAREEKKQKEGDDDSDDNATQRRHSKVSERNDHSAPTGRPKDAIIAGDEPVPGKAKADTTRISITDAAARDSIAADEARKKADEEANMFMKSEYVPVTSFFHTLDLNNYGRDFISYDPCDSIYYASDYYNLKNDSIDDYTQHLSIHNTVGIALLEGFNKYVKAGLKVFGRHELEHYTLPEAGDSTGLRRSSYNEHNIYVGGVISKREGKLLHFNAMGEVCVVGKDIGNINIRGGIDLNFKLFGDTLHLDAGGTYTLRTPTFYYRHYTSRHFQWDNDLSKEGYLHLEGQVSWDKTHTIFTLGLDNIGNYTYFGTRYTISNSRAQKATELDVCQAPSNIQVITARLKQDFAFGIVHFDNVFTFQQSSDNIRLPLPKLNIYSALYLRFKIAHVLDCDLGADVRFFTRYYAPEYSAPISQFVIQQDDAYRTIEGCYPFVNVFANMQLKNCRFYVMMSHVNCSGSGGDYFFTPHYPTNQRVLRLGLSWNFFN